MRLSKLFLIGVVVGAAVLAVAQVEKPPEPPRLRAELEQIPPPSIPPRHFDGAPCRVTYVTPIDPKTKVVVKGSMVSLADQGFVHLRNTDGDAKDILIPTSQIVSIERTADAP